MSTLIVWTLTACVASAAPVTAPVATAPSTTPATSAPAATTSAPTSAPAATAPAATTSVPEVATAASPAAAGAPAAGKLTRIIVQEVEVPAGEERLQAIFTSGLVTEVRKLAGVSVAGLDEVRALIDLEANRQMVGCDDSGCLADLADALGADVVVTARLSTLGDESVIAFRRLDAVSAKVLGVDRRFAKGDGEEFLAAIGPAVAELFPELPVRSGLERGVDKEAALKLNPPPLPPWVFVSATAASALVMASGAAAGTLSSFFESSANDKVARSVLVPIDGVDVKRDVEAADTCALVANAAFVTGGALLVGATVAYFFTDFDGYADAP